MEKVIANLKRDRTKRGLLIGKFETEAEKKLNYYLEEIERNRKDSEEKENYLKRLKRGSTDIHDGAIGAEEGFLKRIKELESNISKLNAEKIEIDERNTKLKEELHISLNFKPT
ncbi:hypothetical protein JTB14_021757 [Gonioctena quinquepunctata]|nr:hypothetical protein JTB14_021757 [Gonioctena quinquepunctata]